MIVAVVVLGVVCLALVAYIAWDKREQAKSQAVLLDRIQAPAAAAFAAMEAAVPYEPLEPPPDLYTEPVPQSDDLALLALVRED